MSMTSCCLAVCRSLLTLDLKLSQFVSQVVPIFIGEAGVAANPPYANMGSVIFHCENWIATLYINNTRILWLSLSKAIIVYVNCV